MSATQNLVNRAEHFSLLIGVGACSQSMGLPADFEIHPEDSVACNVFLVNVAGVDLTCTVHLIVCFTLLHGAVSLSIVEMSNSLLSRNI